MTEKITPEIHMPKRMNVLSTDTTIGASRLIAHSTSPKAAPIQLQAQKHMVTPTGSAGSGSWNSTVTPTARMMNTTVLVENSRMMVAKTRSS